VSAPAYSPADVRRQSGLDTLPAAADPLDSDDDGCRCCYGTGQDPAADGFPCLPCDGTGWRQ
jgi:hypothetical protein